MADDKEPKEGEIRVELRWELEDIPTIYVNHLIITHAGPEFYLIFGETVPINESNPFEPPNTLRIKPKARIAVSREMMPSFIEAINKNFGHFLTKVKEEIEGQAHDNDNS